MNQALTLFLYHFPSRVGYDLFSRQAQKFLLGLGSAGPHHYCSRLCLSHLLPKLRYLCHVPG
jgi:hypothetical protein